jgi:hypothetical protein
MAQTAVRLNVDEAFDVHRDVFAEVALDIALVLDHLADAVYLVFAEILDFLERVYISRSQNPQRTRVSDPKDVSKRDPSLLVAGQIHASNTCHAFSFVAPGSFTAAKRLGHLYLPDDSFQRARGSSQAFLAN